LQEFWAGQGFLNGFIDFGAERMLLPKMKVLICVNRLDYGGAEMLECRLACELNRMGVQAHLACQYDDQMAGQAEAAQRWTESGVPCVHWLKMTTKVGILKAPLILSKIIKANSINCVITSTLGTGIVANIATRYNSAAHVTALHGYYAESTLKSPRFRLWKHFLRKSDGFYSISNFVRKRAEAKLGIPLEKNKLVYNSIKFKNYANCKDPEGLRHEFKIPPSAKVILYVGRLEKGKGCDIMVNALGPKLKDWTAYLLIAGSPVRRKSPVEGTQNFDEVIKKAISFHGIGDRVRILGQRYDVARLMASSDLLIHLARNEGFGLVLLEAIAAGLPVVASSEGGIPEVLRGTPYRPLEIADLATIQNETERWLKMDQAERLKHTEAARKILPFYNDRRRAEEILEVCYEAVKRKNGRSLSKNGYQFFKFKTKE